MFYDPLVETAGPIAEEYEISISDVLGLLLVSGKDEALVRQALSQGRNSDAAQEMQRLGRPFDLVEHARTLLRLAMSESGGVAGWRGGGAVGLAAGHCTSPFACGRSYRRISVAQTQPEGVLRSVPAGRVRLMGALAVLGFVLLLLLPPEVVDLLGFILSVLSLCSFLFGSD
ncbi:MAG TPA: hypothetical protein VF952_11420 [Chloroflexia bacterium]|jgi:hypothetical protein